MEAENIALIISILFIVYFFKKYNSNNSSNSGKSINNNQINNNQKSPEEVKLQNFSSETLSYIPGLFSNISQKVNNFISNKKENFILDNISEDFNIDVPSIKTIVFDKYGEKLGNLIMKTYSQDELENLLYE